MQPWVRKGILPAGIVVGLGFFALAGAFGRTDDGKVKNEEGLEAVQPVNSAEAQARQTIVVADLADGYQGALKIDDVIIPANQLENDQGLNKLIFRPGDGKVLKALRPRENCAEITYWPLEQGPQQGRIYRWCFNVT